MPRTKTTAASLALRKPANGLANLTLEYQDAAGKFKRQATGIKVVPTLWDAATATIKSKGSADPPADTATAREQLAEWNRIIGELRRQLKRFPSAAEFSDALASSVAPVAEAADDSLVVPAVRAFAEAKAVNRAAATVRSMRTLAGNLADFEQESKERLTFANLTNATVQRFQAWMTKQSYKNSTTAKRLMLLKQFLRETAESSGHSVKIARIKHLHANISQAPVVLSRSEIEAILALESLPAKLERVRDVFVVQLYTGLRYSDVQQLERRHVDWKNNCLVIRMQKTRQVVTLPLLAPVAAVLRKYMINEQGDFELPAISNQKQNAYLKELCALVPALHVLVARDEARGSTIVSVERAKYELIATHRLRASFVTLLLQAGRPVAEVISYTGHKDLRTLQKYAGVSEVTAATAAGLDAALNQ